MGGNGGWGSWWLSSFLLGLGVLAGLAALTMGLVGAMSNANAPTLASAGLTVGIAALALIGAGGVLRWSAYCCDDCDWDEGQELVQIQGTKAAQK